MKQRLAEWVRYGIVGLINTGSGLAIIFLCMFLGTGDVAANLIGYACGFVISFFLNGRWTFRRPTLNRGNLVFFALITCLAYLVNLWAMLFTRDRLALDSEIAQLCGVLAYAIVGFLGMKFVAFRPAGSTHRSQ